MLHSIVGQSYDNWKLIVIDDVSTDEEEEQENFVIETFQHMTDDLAVEDTDNDMSWRKIIYLSNDVKKWEVTNVLTGIKLCEDDDIICRIDADDYLVDLDALAIINEVYKLTNCDALWTMHRWGLSDFNISAPMSDNADPYKHPWVSSHLKTFRKKLINGISIDNFKNMEGNLVQRAGDQCVFLPVLHRAKKRVFLPRVMYHYTIDVEKPGLFTCDDSKFQKAEADFIRQRGFVSSGDSWEKSI